MKVRNTGHTMAANIIVSAYDNEQEVTWHKGKFGGTDPHTQTTLDKHNRCSIIAQMMQSLQDDGRAWRGGLIWRTQEY